MQAHLHLKACWRCPARRQASGCAHAGCAGLPFPFAPEHLLPLRLQVAKLQASIQELQDAHQREEEACAEAQQVAEEALQLKRDLEARHVPCPQQTALCWWRLAVLLWLTLRGSVLGGRASQAPSTALRGWPVHVTCLKALHKLRILRSGAAGCIGQTSCTFEKHEHILEDCAAACRVADLEAGVLEDAEREAEQRTLAAANSRLEQQVGASH